MSRRVITPAIGARIVTDFDFASIRTASTYRRGGGTIDLDEDDYHRTEAGDSPWKRDDPDRLR